MKRYLATLLAALLLAAGFTAIAVAPAEAHTGDLKVTAVCQDDGNYLLTVKLTTSNVPNNVTGSTKWRIGTSAFDGTPGSDSGMNKGPVGTTGNQTVTLGTFTLPGNTTGKGPWVYAFTKWSNNNSKGSDGQLLNDLDGKCKPKVVKDAAASVSKTPATCDVPEKLVYGAATHATYSGTPNGTAGPANYNVTATANAGHQFPDGTSAKNFTGSLGGKLTGQQCHVKPPDATVTENRMTCAGGVEKRDGKREYIWDGNAYVLEPMADVAWGPWTHVRDLTFAEKQQLGCIPGQPDPVTKVEQRKSCDDGLEERTTTWTWVYDAQTDQWVKSDPNVGPWVFVRDLTDAELIKYDCSPPPCDDECKIPAFPTNAPKVTTCTGVISHRVLNNVVVPKGRSCTLVDVFLNGGFNANGAHDITMADVTVRGSVRSTGHTGDFTFGAKGNACRYDPMVGGSLTVKNGHNVLICQASVCKDIVVQNNDGKITVRESKAHRIVVVGNKRFDSDGGGGHARLSVIRLIDNHGKYVIKNNAPRKVQIRK